MNTNTAGQKSPLPGNASAHVNVMEALVYEEIDKQLRFYPKNLKTYLNLTEVATYALNRLPPLYASSQKGVEEQRRVAARQYKSELTSAVRRAIAAVERDPLRSSTPIVSEMEVKYQEAENTLNEIQQILQSYQLLDYDNQVLTWENCPRLLRRVLLHLIQDQRPPAQGPPPPPSAFNGENYPPPPPPPPIKTPRVNLQEVDPTSTLW
jgi:hypothetical protein